MRELIILTFTYKSILRPTLHEPPCRETEKGQESGDIGDRRDEDIREQTRIIGEAFDDVVLYQDACQRGREDGEVLKLLQEGLVGTACAAVGVGGIAEADQHVARELGLAYLAVDLLQVLARPIFDLRRGEARSAGTFQVGPSRLVGAETIVEDTEFEFHSWLVAVDQQGIGGGIHGWGWHGAGSGAADDATTLPAWNCKQTFRR